MVWLPFQKDSTTQKPQSFDNMTFTSLAFLDAIVLGNDMNTVLSRPEFRYPSMSHHLKISCV